MSRVLIFDLDEASLPRLKQRAARHGRSIECEAAAILSQALGAADSWSRTNELRDG
jgi:plasmid stability protein